MAFGVTNQKSELLKSQFGGTYYIEYDTLNRAYRVVQASKEDYDNDFGAVIYEESFDKMSKDGSSIENGVDRLLKNFGGVAFVNKTRTLVGDTIVKDKLVPQQLLDGYTSPFWAARENLAKDEVTSENEQEKTAGQIQQEWQGGLEAETIKKNQENAANLSVNTASLPVIAKTLTYPEDLDREIQDTLQIDVYKYEPARGLPNVDLGTEGTNSGRFLRTTKRNGRTRKPITTITIPIPNAVGDSNAVQWGGGSFSSVAGTLGNEINNAIFGTLQSGTERGSGLERLIKSFTDLGNAAGGGVMGAVKGAGTLLGNEYVQRKVLLENLAKAAGFFNINVDVAQVITRTGGVIENPNLELLFTGPSLRSFQFTVRFTPRSASESKIVRQIIRVLKQHSAVKKGVTLGTGGFSSNDPNNPNKNKNLLLGTPDVFTLKYKQAGVANREIKGITKMKTCALTNLSVDYTGEAGRWAAYDGDSQPVTTLVTMNFAELAPIYDTDYINNSLADDDVGF